MSAEQLSPIDQRLRPWKWPMAFRGTAASRALFCAGLGAVCVTGQAFVLRGTPIHFAPSLGAILLLTWRFGFASGVASLVATALTINFAVLEPQWTWSISHEALIAITVYVLVGLSIVASIQALRVRFRRLERELRRANTIAEEEARTRREHKEALELQLSDLREKFESLSRSEPQEFRTRRYVDALENSLVEVRSALEDFPVPIALIQEDGGIPVLREASRALIELGDLPNGTSPAFLSALGCIVTPAGQQWHQTSHPLVCASRGVSIHGLPIGWLSSGGRFRQAKLFASPVARGTMLAVAIVVEDAPAPADSMAN